MSRRLGLSRKGEIDIAPKPKTIAFLGDDLNPQSAKKLNELVNWLKDKSWLIFTGDDGITDRAAIYACQQRQIKITVCGASGRCATKTKVGRNYPAKYASPQRDDVLVVRCSVIVLAGDSTRAAKAEMFAKQLGRKVVYLG